MGGGGGKVKTPPVEKVEIPTTPAAPPPPEPVALAPEKAGDMERQEVTDKQSKRRGTSQLQVALNLGGGSSGGSSGLNIPKG